MKSQPSEHHILVIGAGYAGVMAALRAAGRTRRHGGRVTLVNASDRFVERIRLHQLAAGKQLRDIPIRHLLRGSGVEFVQGRVTALELAHHRVEIDGPTAPQSLAYDTLIYALGSATDMQSVPGVAEHAYSLSNPDSARSLYAAVQAAAKHGGRLVVCGGGPTGIEASTELAEAFPELHVSLVTREEFGGGVSRRGQTHLAKVFARRGIDVIDRTEVRAVRERSIEVEDRASLPFDVCLWAGSFGVPALAREAGLEVNARGQIVVDAFLRSRSHPDILAAGDAAIPTLPSGALVRMSCATALPMGAHAADTAASLVRGDELLVFRYGYTGIGISLGSRDALGQPLHADDSPRSWIATGRTAAWIREAFSRITVYALEVERRWPGAFRWPQGPSAAVPQLGRFDTAAKA